MKKGGGWNGKHLYLLIGTDWANFAAIIIYPEGNTVIDLHNDILINHKLYMQHCSCNFIMERKNSY